MSSIKEKDKFFELMFKEHNLRIGDRYFDDGYNGMDVVQITDIYENEVRVMVKYENNGESSERSLRDFTSHYDRLPDSYQTLGKQEIIKTAIEASFKEKHPDDVEADTESTAIMDLDKHLLLEHKRRLEDATRTQELMEAALQSHRRHLQRIRSTLQGQISRVQDILDTIELYLGIYEQVIQIRTGEKAPMETPICLRQQLLYMDEECAIIINERDEGVDFQNEEQFDDWVFENFQKLIPEEKGVVCLMISRRRREYSPDPLTNAHMNSENKCTYILIRNGDNLYRIWTSVDFSPRLFAKLDEYDPKKDNSVVMKHYNKKMLAIQGILDRSEILKPMPHRIDLFHPLTYKNDKLIKLIRDEENNLPPGRNPWKLWKALINSKIEHGTRIYMCHHFDSAFSKENCDRWRFRAQDYEQPPFGMYNIEGNGSRFQNACYKCYYKPQSGTWSWTEGYNDRKNRASFLIDMTDDILNYDLITMEDIDWYLNNRTDRVHYFSYIPILKRMRKMKIEEKKQEDNFVRFMIDNYFDQDAEESIRKAIEWWKYKVIMKRPLMREDAKAVRMIRGRVKRMIAGEEFPDIAPVELKFERCEDCKHFTDLGEAEPIGPTEDTWHLWKCELESVNRCGHPSQIPPCRGKKFKNK